MAGKQQLTPGLIRGKADTWARHADNTVVLFLMILGFEALAFIIAPHLPHVAGPTGNPLYVGYLAVYLILLLGSGIPMTICVYRCAYWGTLAGDYPVNPKETS